MTPWGASENYALNQANHIQNLLKKPGAEKESTLEEVDFKRIQLQKDALSNVMCYQSG